MSDWIAPQYSRSRVKTAGKKIRGDDADLGDYAVLENWRRAHARVLNTFQMRLRRTRFGGTATVAQRLKRRPTIVDKLRREPNMQLTTMHDIAGCRAIFENIDDLNSFRMKFLDTRSKHVHINKESDHFDYITNPKPSGYRGVHEVFEHRLSNPSSEAWNGLKVEIQLRTRAQHAWATAVETVDLLNGDRAKFGQASSDLQRFFLLASEIIARKHENSTSYLDSLGDSEVLSEFSLLDSALGILHRLSEATATAPRFARNRNTILIFHFDGERKLEVRTYDSINPALRAYEELEEELKDEADVVLVKAEHSEDLRRAFQNYFSDAREFVSLLQ